MIVEAFLFLYLFTGRGCAGGENTILRGNTLFYGIRKMRAVRETRKAADGRFQIFSYLCSGFRMAGGGFFSWWRRLFSGPIKSLWGIPYGGRRFFALRPPILAGSPVSGGC